MHVKNINNRKLLLKSKKQNSLETSNYLNLPDLRFYNWCNRQYAINRGVYNTIDQWFYDYGMIHIHSRRIHILAFLEFAKEEKVEEGRHKYIRFGQGGLIRNLDAFMNETGKRSNIIQLK